MKKILLLIGLLLPVQGNAANYVGSGKIKFMQNAYGGWIFTTDGANSNPDVCSKNTIILEANHGQYKEVYSFLLSAYMSGNVYVNGCTTPGYKKLSFIYSTL